MDIVPSKIINDTTCYNVCTVISAAGSVCIHMPLPAPPVGKTVEGNQQEITWSITERGSSGADSGQVSSGRPWRKVITSVPLAEKSFGP